jgi:adenylate cyclase
MSGTHPSAGLVYIGRSPTEEGISEARKVGCQIAEIDPTSAKGHQLIAVADFHLVYMAFAGDPELLKDEALQEARPPRQA